MMFLAKEEFAKVFSSLRKEFDIFGPTIKQGQGIYSDTDICVYGRLDAFQELSLKDRTYFSAKEIAFPVSEKLFEFMPDGPKEPRATVRKKIIFARSCDMEGFLRLDKVYLNNNSLDDFYYKRLRKNISFFLIECTESFEGCFCQSVDSSTTQEYAVLLRKADEGFFITLKDKSFAKWFKSYDTKIDESLNTHRCESSQQDKVNIPDLSRKELFKDSLWDELAKRCIGCGRCNLVCPSCSCFNVYDTIEDKGGFMRGFMRKRIWSACQIDGFAKVAGGHEYRTDKGQRMRYKILHKFYNFKERFGTFMCVGCGRCIEACPEYIDIRVTLKNLNHG